MLTTKVDVILIIIGLVMCQTIKAFDKESVLASRYLFLPFLKPHNFLCSIKYKEKCFKISIQIFLYFHVN